MPFAVYRRFAVHHQWIASVAVVDAGIEEIMPFRVNLSVVARLVGSKKAVYVCSHKRNACMVVVFACRQVCSGKSHRGIVLSAYFFFCAVVARSEQRRYRTIVVKRGVNFPI